MHFTLEHSTLSKITTQQAILTHKRKVFEQEQSVHMLDLDTQYI